MKLRTPLTRQLNSINEAPISLNEAPNCINESWKLVSEAFDYPCANSLLETYPFLFLEPMSNLDERSHKLILQILQSSGDGSKCDSEALLQADREMEQLLALIPRLPGLRKDPHPDYLEAVNKMLMEVKRKFPDFERFARKKQVNLAVASAIEVRECFVWWVNQFLRFDVLDLYRKRKQPLPVSLDAPMSEDDERTLGDRISNEGFKPPTWDGLEDFIRRSEQEQIRRKGEALERYIETDPDSLLRECYCNDNPDCNCQNIAKLAYLANRGGEITVMQGQRRIAIAPAEPKVSVRAFASSLGISEQTIHSHWKRHCRKILRSFLQEFEQQEMNGTNDT